MPNIIINWFRQDLRITDNPSLSEAARNGRVLPVYILDDKHAGNDRIGEAGRWWLHQSLNALNDSVDGKLAVFKGNPIEILLTLASKYNVSSVYWNRCYEPWRIKGDKKIKDCLKDRGISVQSFNASLLWEPWEIQKKDGTPYRVFTPFYRNGCLGVVAPRTPLPKPSGLKLVEKLSHATAIEELGLLPEVRWDKKMESHWKTGEKGALQALQKFIQNGLHGYKEGRNYPAQPNTSGLSPHLHYGEISPNQVWYAIRGTGSNEDIDNFCSELGWREFSYNLLYYNPEFPTRNFQPKFDNFPWKEESSHLQAWQKGQTGYPIIDAGMRELWQTGYMHNRLRMIVGSFLVKNLLIHWRKGFEWFWSCLVDADLANNSAGWQWVAGSGADAAPYFRIFNPVTQSKRFDPEGVYIRKWVPELCNLSDKYIHAPYEASEDILKKADITLGKEYPKPIVNLKASREQALAAFKSI